MTSRPAKTRKTTAEKHPFCYRHPETQAVAACSECFAPLCVLCRKHDGTATFCAECMVKARRTPVLRGAALLVGLALAGGAAYWAYKSYVPPYDYGARAADIRKLETELGKEPCDRKKVQQLLQEMMWAGDARGVLNRADAFYAKCGPHLPLRTTTYEAHQRLGEFDAAIADLNALAEHDPYSFYYPAWRGRVHQEKGDLDHAAEDFRQALLLYPKLSDIPLNLATVYEQQGKFCEAAFPLHQLVFYYPDQPWTGGVRARIATLEQKGACGVAGTGHATIRFEPGATLLRAKVRLGNDNLVSLIVDTGASYVTITRALADRIGVQAAGAPKVTLRTANGTKPGWLVLLPSIAIEGLEAKNVPAVVVDDLGPNVEGLLGLSFLTRFDMRQSEGVMELSVRAR